MIPEQHWYAEKHEEVAAIPDEMRGGMHEMCERR